MAFTVDLKYEDLLVNVATRETCITINAIRNRYVELIYNLEGVVL